jgi:hypothetical protein
MHIYGVRPRKDRRGFDLISDVLPFGRLWYGDPDAITNAVGYAKFYSRSHDAAIRVYDQAGKVIETHEQTAWQFPRVLKRRAERIATRLLFPGR